MMDSSTVVYGIDLGTATFIGLITIGFVNVLTMWKADLDSRVKFAAAVAVAFVLSFVPVDLGNLILNHLKVALEVGFASSGAYKLSQVVKSRIG